MWVVFTGVPSDATTWELLDPMCGFKEVILDGDDKVCGALITVENKTFWGLLGRAVALDAGLQVLHAAALALQHRTL